MVKSTQAIATALELGSTANQPGPSSKLSPVDARASRQVAGRKRRHEYRANRVHNILSSRVRRIRMHKRRWHAIQRQDARPMGGEMSSASRLLIIRCKTAQMAERTFGPLKQVLLRWRKPKTVFRNSISFSCCCIIAKRVSSYFVACPIAFQSAAGRLLFLLSRPPRCRPFLLEG